MAFPVNHKTVFVMDHSPHFAIPCSVIEMDFKTAGQHLPPPSIKKTIWTSAVESFLEYARIVYDIFPPDTDELKLIRMVVSDAQDNTEVVNTWSEEDQNSNALCAGLALVGPPQWKIDPYRAKDLDLRRGLAKALHSLVELSPTQERYKSGKIVNRGRIVLLAHILDKDLLKDMFCKLFLNVNEMASSSETMVPLSEVELEVVHCFSPNDYERSTNVEMSWADPSLGLSMRIISVAAGADLSKKLLCLALRHYDLASTTVTGIPMKEEQNASSSANYDVELFHKASAHTKLFSLDGYSATAPVDLQSWMPQTMKEGCEYKTVTLKWCTPRGNCGSELQHCIGATRITPTDVNSRPSSCLTNFLLSGRSVMLEMPRRIGSKILSHMLTSHGGEIFIHTLGVSRSVLEDPPSISEGPGGRVTDYRITDFGELMKSNMLAPHFGESKPGVEDPISRSSKRLSRFTLFCPMIISGTTILNMSAIMPLYNIVIKEEITEEDLAECRRIICGLLSMEKKGDPLPVPMNQTPAGGSNPPKNKTPKKEEQYKMMFAELEKFLSAHCRTERHGKVLDCLLEVRNRPKREQDKVDLDVALREIERYSSMPEKGPQSLESSEPHPPLKRLRVGNQSLLGMVMTKIEKEKALNQTPFAGMKSVGEKARLYLNLDKSDTDGPLNLPEM